MSFKATRKESAKDVSNAHFNKWFRDRGLTLDPAEKGSGTELRNLIPFMLFKKF